MGGRGGSGGSGGGSRAGGIKAAKAKMPELKGSPKQVSWAESIRTEALTAAYDLDRRYKDMQSRSPKDKNFAVDTLGFDLKDAAVIQKEVVSTLQDVTSASKIIDARRNLSASHIDKLAKLEHRTGEVSEFQKKRKK